MPQTTKFDHHCVKDPRPKIEKAYFMNIQYKQWKMYILNVKLFSIKLHIYFTHYESNVY